MSKNEKTVEDRVVSMQFDNSKFEKNVDQSIKTLDRLKKSLNMDSAAKGFNELNKASKNVSFDGLSSGVETVKNRFSAMEVVGITALANITTAAMRAGANIVKSLTLDQVMGGFNEYELKMGSIQTIMAGTGESLETVTSYLNELNEYSDKTIYSFADMTQNIGKFTNAGVSLDKAVMAIKGISNEAAISGANAQEASRAMYNFSQALSAGYVKLIDWKSIENANMATKEFKQQLINTAVELGTLKKVGEDTYQTLEKGTEMNSVKKFNDTLEEQWLTTDVLVKTLEMYADENTEIGAKATEAATKVRKFTQLMDTLKEAVGSGWAQTFEIVIGNFNEATDVFTGLSDYFGDVIGKIAESRNAFFRGAMSSGFVQMTSYMEDAGIKTEEFTEKLKEVGKAHGVLTDEMIEKAGSLKDTLKSGWLSEDILRETIKSLDKTYISLDQFKKLETTNVATNELRQTFIDMAVALGTLQDVGNGVYATGERQFSLMNGFNDSLQDQWMTMGVVNKVFEQYGENLEDAMRNGKLTEEQARALLSLKESAAEANIPISELVNNMTRPSGRELVIDTIKNGWASFVEILKAFRGAWNETFESITSSDLYGVLERINKSSKNLLAGVQKNSDKLKRTLKGLFSIIDLIGRAVKFTLNSGLKLFGALIGGASGDVLSLSSNIGDLLVAFHDWVLEHNNVTKAISKFVDMIANAITVSKKWVRQHVDLDEAFQTVKTVLKEVCKVIAEVVEELGVGEAIQKKASQAAEKLSSVYESLTKNMSGAGKGVKTFISSLSEIRKSSKGVETLVKTWNSFKTNVIDGILKKGKESLDKTNESIKEFVQNGADAADNLGNKFEELRDRISNSIKAMQDALGSDFISQALAAGIGATIMVITYKIAQLLGAVRSSIFDFTGGIAGVLAGTKTVLLAYATEIKAKALVEVAKAILLLVAALGGLALLAKYDWDSLKKGAIVLGALMVAMTGMIAVLTKLSGSGELASLTSAAVIMSLAVSIGVLVGSLKTLNGMNIKYLGQELLILGTFILGLIGAIKLMSLASKGIPECALELIAIAVAIKILVSAIGDLSELDLSNMKKENWSALIGCIGMLTALMVACSFSGKNAAMGGAALVAVAVALKTLCSALEDFMKLDLSKMTGRHVALLVGFLAGISVLMIATGKTGPNALKASAALLLDIVAMHMLLSLIKKIQEMGSMDLKKTLTTLGVVSGIIAALLTVYHVMGKGTGKAGLLLLSIGAALVSISVAIVMLGKLDTGSLIKGVGAITIIMGMMTFMTTKMGTVKGSWKVIMALTACIGALTLGVAALSFIRPEKLLGATAALAALMGSMSLLVKSCKNAYASIKTIVLMTTMIVLLGGIVIALTKLNPEGALKSAGSIAILLTAMSASITLLSKFGSFAGEALASMGIMLAIVAGLGIIITLMSKFADGDNAIKMATSLSELILALSAACAILTIVGLGGPAALIGVGSLAAVIGAIVALSVTLGALKDKYSAFEEFLNTGMPILESIGSAIGRFLGNIVSGFASGALSCLPELANMLSLFMTNLNPFLKASKNIDPASTKGANEIIKSILALTAVNLLDSISRFIGFGKGGIDGFTENAKTLAEGVVEFSKTIEKSKIDTAKIRVAAEAGAMIANMAAKLPNSGGLAGLLLGENDPDEFGNKLKAFAKGLVSFSDTVSSTTINLEAIRIASDAGVLIAEMAAKLPNSGGLASLLAGENDMDKFAKKLGGFADGIIEFSSKVSNTTINVEAVKLAAQAGKTIAKMASEIPNTGGLAGLFAGDNDLGSYGEKLKSFGEAIANFSESVTAKGVNLEAVTTACKAMDILSKAIPEEGGLWSALTNGSKNMSTFGKELATFGNAIADFSYRTRDVKPEHLSAVCSAIGDVADAFAKTGGKACTNMTSLLGGIKDVMVSKQNTFKKEGKALVNAMAEGMVAANDTVATKFQTIVDKSVSVITSQKGSFYSAGGYVVQGFANGIEDKSYLVSKAVSKMATKYAVQVTMKKLQIHSPSRVAEKLGGYYDMGFARGVNKFAGYVSKAVSGMSNDAVTGLKDSINSVYNSIQNGIDATPVIRPVIDLSDVRSGVSSIGSMFGSQYELATSVGSISAMMNGRALQATNDDVVSAIGKLRKDIANIQGNTYNVNGVTYDDGSNVSSAIETLVRAARIERRS